ncbi:MAG: endonuclease/exonuclease/phosphatase family protein, partial [bacterium]
MLARYILIAFVFMTSSNLSAQVLDLISYNIRLDIESDKENKWDNRKHFLVKQLIFHEPDIFGIQEGLNHQVEFIDSSLPDYEFTGVGRNNGKEDGEYCAIFYNTSKVKMISGSTFWLSQTPEEPSMGWDAGFMRICTYAFFEILESGKKILVFNTHFDNSGEQSRKESAKLILQKEAEINTENYPIILLGDMNFEPETEVYNYLQDRFNDSKKASEFVFGPQGTFNAFEFCESVKRRIDFIFTDKESVSVLRYAVLSDSRNKRYPSDHLPV